MKKIALKTYYLFFAALTLWFILSWFEVATHNTAPDPTYSAINMFKLFTMLF